MAETPNTSAPRRSHQRATLLRDGADTPVAAPIPVLAGLASVLGRLGAPGAARESVWIIDVVFYSFGVLAVGISPALMSFTQR